MLVGLQVLGQFLDSLGQYGHLSTGTTSIVLMSLRAFNGGGFLFGCYHNVQSFYQIAAPSASPESLKCVQLLFACWFDWANTRNRIYLERWNWYFRSRVNISRLSHHPRSMPYPN